VHKQLKGAWERDVDGLRADVRSLLADGDGTVLLKYLNDDNELDFRTRKNGVCAPLARVVMGTLELGVSEGIGWPVVKWVIETATNLKVCHDISRSTMYNIVERLDVVNHMYVAFRVAGYMDKEIVPAFCGGHDGTMYHGRNIAGMTLQFGEHYLALGAVDVADGTAVTAFTAFVQKLERLCATLKDSEVSLEINKFLLGMRSSLSDKCAVETKWARLLEEKKFDILEATAEFNALSKEEQARLAEVRAREWGRRVNRRASPSGRASE
jgi:hypothetical protein